MKSARFSRSLVYLALGSLLAPWHALADAVVTTSDLRVEGTIISEDEKEIQLKTERYGDLRFQKMNLKSITRGANTQTLGGADGGAAAAPQGGGAPNPFGAGSDASATPPNPFAAPSSGEAPNPFGGAPAAGGSSAPNPFGGGAPPAGANPFGNAAPTGGGAPSNPFDTGAPAGGGNPFGSAPAAGGGNPPDPFQSGPPADSGNPFGGPPAAGGGPAVNPFDSGAPAAGGNPFGNGATQGGGPPAPNPFDTGAASPGTNPFGGAPAQPSGNPANPFDTGGAAPGGAPDPFAAAAAAAALPATNDETNPFAAVPGSATMPLAGKGQAPGPARPGPASGPAGGKQVAAAAQQAPPTPKPYTPQPPSAAVPTVRMGFDATVFGIKKDGPVDIAEVKDQWRTTTDNTDVRVGWSIRTGRKSVAQVVLRGTGDQLRIPPASEVVIEKLDPAGKEVTVRLQDGSVWSDVKPRGEVQGENYKFKVVTSEVTAGVTGTTFAISRNSLEYGTRVAVIEGTVRAKALRTKASAPVAGNQMVTINNSGQISPPVPLSEEIRRQYEDWDNWAAEAQASLGGFDPFGIVNGQIQLAASDNAAHAAIVAEGNSLQRGLNNGKAVDAIGDEFLAFAGDTGHVPDSDSVAGEGFEALVSNTGNWQGWKGPYHKGAFPPLDTFGRPMRYIVRISRSGNVHGVVYSIGADGIDNGGKSPQDDIRFVMFRDVDAIRNNPEYAPDKMLAKLKAAEEAGKNPKKKSP